MENSITVNKYRKKPVEIEAIRWYGDNLEEVEDFADQHIDVDGPASLVISTPEGDMIVSEGDYIIKGIKGEFYPCRSDIFHASYELIDNKPID